MFLIPYDYELTDMILSHIVLNCVLKSKGLSKVTEYKFL